MSLLEAPTPEAPETPVVPVVAEAPEPVVRACASCGTAMVAQQDWCLECGTAAPGRLGVRPGWRAVGTTLALTLVLVGGAVAASYAALSSESTREASAAAPPDGTPVAQVPPVVPGPAAAPVPPVAPVAGPTGAAGAVAPKLPPVKPLPVAPKVTPPVPPPAVSTSTTSPGAGTKTGTKTTTTPAKPAAPAALAPLTLGADAGSGYDPYGRVTEQGDAADAYDADAETTWNVTTKADGKPMQVGYVIDLGAVKDVEAVELTTATPGFSVEVYGADGSELPPDILDTRWTNAGSRSAVDEGRTGSNKAGDRKERIVLRRGGGEFRYVLLWLTTPPEDGPSVGLTQVDVLA